VKDIIFFGRPAFLGLLLALVCPSWWLVLGGSGLGLLTWVEWQDSAEDAVVVAFGIIIGIAFAFGVFVGITIRRTIAGSRPDSR
jgi:hypothetical protein